MSNERTDQSSGNEGRPPPDWPGAAKAREQAEAAENQVLPPDIEPYEPEPPVLSHVDNEPVIIGNEGRTVEEQAAVDARREAERAEDARSRSSSSWLLIGAVAGVAILIAGLFLLFGGGGGDDEDTTANNSPGGTGGQAAAPTSPPPTNVAAAPAAFTANAQQLRNANVIATDLTAIYGTCAYELPTNGATDVEQSVSSSPAMMQAMTAAGYQGFRSSSRTPTPCQGLPYNAASVSGNARDVAAAQALFAAARTNYQALFPGFTPFDVPKGQLDEVYCQHGVFVPAGNIIAVACWMRKGTTVTGVFILLPPGSAQTVIDEAKRDAQAYVTRLDGVLR